jgi:hypothetical protein
MPEASDRASLTRELAAAGVFDGVWYLRRYEDVAAAGKDALHHFTEYGWAERRWSNRYFDPAWYRRENPDVTAAGVDPLLHYIRDGEREGRRPHPVFDPVWYRSAYAVADDHLAFGHYIANRMSGGFVPCADLFVIPLIAPYRDDVAAGVDPVAHYLDDGGDLLPDLPVVLASRLVDENYYLINAADVHEANADPSVHYCRYGWREQRKPNIYFDPGWYVQTNPEVARLKVNPLVHYILVGEAANRRPVPFFDPGWYRVEYGVPPEQCALSHFVSNRRKQIYSPNPLFDVGWYMERFGGDLGPNRDPFMHFLQAGMTKDIDPSRAFDIARYRRAHLGRPSRGFLRVVKAEQHNPLVHYLRAEYAARDAGA